MFGKISTEIKGSLVLLQSRTLHDGFEFALVVPEILYILKIASYGYAKLCISITGYFQNVLSYKDDEAKLKSVLFGNGFTKTQAAFNLCAQFEKYGCEDFLIN